MTRVPLTEDSFRDQAIDYLDDLMSEEERAAFEDACRANPAWDTYVAELGATWRRARRVLQQAQQPAPTRVMAHVIAEAEKRAAVLAATTVPTMLAVQDQRSSRDMWSVVKGWFARPWLAPALVATAAVGVYVFSQESWKAARPHSVAMDSVQQEAAKETPPDRRPAPGAAQPALNASEALAERKQDVGGHRTSRGRGEGGGAPIKAADRRAMKPAKGKAEAADDTIGGLLDEAPAQPGLGTGDIYAAPPSGWGKAAAKKVAADGVNQAAPPPPEPTAQAPRRAPTAASGAAQEARAPSRATSAAPAAAPATPAQGLMRLKEAEESAPADAYVNAPERDDATKAKAPALSRADLLQKAAFAETNADWHTAARTYRELLQRFPNDKDVPAWKRRLAAANAQAR